MSKELALSLDPSGVQLPFLTQLRSLHTFSGKVIPPEYVIKILPKAQLRGVLSPSKPVSTFHTAAGHHQQAPLKNADDTLLFYIMGVETGPVQAAMVKTRTGPDRTDR